MSSSKSCLLKFFALAFPKSLLFLRRRKVIKEACNALVRTASDQSNTSRLNKLIKCRVILFKLFIVTSISWFRWGKICY